MTWEPAHPVTTTRRGPGTISPHAVAAIVLLIGFNLWHLTNRGIWNGSLGDALTLGPQVRELAATIDPSLRVYKPYDGQFYYAMTFDPWLRTHEVVPLLDVPAYRYRRMLLPALASLLALGSARQFPLTLLLVDVASWLLCGWAAWRLARNAGLAAGWAALGVLGTTGLVYAAFRTLPEALALALVLGGLLAWQRERRLLAAALLGLAPLAREEALLPGLTLFAYAAFRERREFRRLVPLVVPLLLPIALWWLYLRSELPPLPPAMNSRFGLPFQGLLRETAAAFEVNETRTHLLRTLTANAVALWLCLEAFLGCRRAPTLWGALTLTQAGLCALLRGDFWVYWAGSIRVLVPLSVFSLFWFLERAKPRPAAAQVVRDGAIPFSPVASST